jgi:hypothetical protein
MFCCKSQAAIEVHDSITLISPASTIRSNSQTKCTDIIPNIILFSETTTNSPSRDAYESITPPKELATPPITKSLSITTNEFIAESHHEGIIHHRNLIILDPSDNFEEVEDPKPVIAEIHVQEYYNVNIARWDERLFSSSTPASEHGTYFPVLINQETRELLLYNENQQTWRDHCCKPDWLTIPGIDFLPGEVDNIIAGDGGLLCVNGGTQPRSKNIHTPPIPHAEDYNLHQYPQQSILVVCNPLTQEFKFIPRHANKKLDRKVACMQILSNHPPNPNPNTTSSSDTKPPPKTRYQLHVLGTHYEPPTLHGPGSHELILMTYDSRSDSWIYGTVVGRARVSSFAKTGIACTEDGFYLGGQEETDECTVVKDDVRAKRICSFGNEGLGCRSSRARRVWVNKIFYVQASSLNWHSVDFRVANVGDSQPIGSKGLQTPRVVQCRPGGPV